MVVELWEFIQGNKNVPLFVRGTLSACELHVQKVQRGAHGCLRIMGLKREERGVALSSGVLEMK